MTDVDAAVASLEESISAWPRLFKDLNNGGDTRNWQELTVKKFAPAALFGQALPSGISLPGVFDPGEMTRTSFPAFVDDDPDESESRYPTPEGAKVKFKGKSAKGIVAITDTSIKIVHLYQAAVMAATLDRRVVTHVNEVAMKFSMLSMTSAGAGYEVLFAEGGDFGRLLFRVALEPRSPNFTETLRGLIMPSPEAATSPIDE